jgi:hypothetical protein
VPAPEIAAAIPGTGDTDDDGDGTTCESVEGGEIGLEPRNSENMNRHDAVSFALLLGSFQMFCDSKNLWKSQNTRGKNESIR